jgi:hypothetical protein
LDLEPDTVVFVVLVTRLRKSGHDVVAASPRTGVNTITGEGLAEALADAQVVVDVANSRSFEEKAALDFSERRVVGCLLQKPPPAWGITLRCQLSVPSAFSTWVVSGRRWSRRS